MKKSSLTIRLDRALERQLASIAKRSGRSRSDIARDALRRQLAILQFEDARRSVMPFAEARGLLTDEDVWDSLSDLPGVVPETHIGEIDRRLAAYRQDSDPGQPGAEVLDRIEARLRERGG